jgi:hypothetical protein
MRLACVPRDQLTPGRRTLVHHDQLQYTEFLVFLNHLERKFGVALLEPPTKAK